MRPSSIAGFALIASLRLTAAVPQCATCHPKEAADHVQTRMAHALVPVLQSAFARNLPNHPLAESNGGYIFEYRQVGQGLAVTTMRGLDEAQGFIRWVVGAGAQGQTPLVETREGIAQHRVSYFPQLQRYGITVGDDAGASANAEAALGRTWSKKDLRDCLNCHATSVSSDLKSFTPGVQCLKCHPGANEHTLGHGVPFNPGKIDAEAQVRFCGQCHRVEAAPNGNTLETIRFQPLRLMKSKCFASGKLACTTCHVAHHDALRSDPDYYNGKCLSCHVGLPHVRQQQTANCIGCHMPEVQLGQTLRFTDHDIRIVKTAAAAPQ